MQVELLEEFYGKNTDFLSKTLSPARFRLIFFILASLIVVPVWRDASVEVNELYRYDIDDVKENQVVFAYCEKSFAC